MQCRCYRLVPGFPPTIAGSKLAAARDAARSYGGGATRENETIVKSRHTHRSAYCHFEISFHNETPVTEIQHTQSKIIQQTQYFLFS